jgi:hypothetical protein
MKTTEKRLRELIIEELQTALQEEEVNEISKATEVGRGGWQGVYQYSKEGMEFLDSLAGKFNGQDEPEELAQAAKRFELINGAAKTAFARDVAPTWAHSNPKEMDKYSQKHRTSFYEEKGNE